MNVAVPTMMRPRVIAEYIQRHDRARVEMSRAIDRRDDAHRALNQHYGYCESDGSVSIGKKSSVVRGYAIAYDAIEADFRVRYDAIRDENLQQDAATLSVYEYLVLDNADANAGSRLDLFAREHSTVDWADFISARASADLEAAQRRDGRIGFIRDAVRFNLSDFSYRAARCRRLLRVRLHDIGSNFAIWSFKRAYARALDNAFAALRIP